MVGKDIKAIVFDLDGVLVDAKEWHTNALRYALGMFGCHLSNKELLQHKGGTLDFLQQLFEEGRPIIVDRAYRIKKYCMNTIIDDECRPISRIIDAVEFARDHCDGNIALVTNCSKYTAHKLIDAIGLKDYFLHIITSTDVKQPKPHYEGYTLASLKLDISPRNCLAIEDSDIGILAAVEARYNTLRIGNFSELSKTLLQMKLKALEIRI